MKMTVARMAVKAGVLGVLLALAGCGDRIEDTEMPQPPQANVEINRQGMEGASQQGMAQGVANDTASMGAAPAGMAAMDADTRIARDVRTAFASTLDFGSTKIDVHSDEGAVTLRGRAPDPAARERAADIARSVRDVKSVDNQLTLG